MPQKAIFSRAPLMTSAYSALSNGQVRTKDAAAERLYGWLCARGDDPETWEGAFELACMLRDAPLEETAARRIREALQENETGMLAGSWAEQLHIARAGLALYEYTVEKDILRRLAAWCGALEVHWDEALADRMIRICPADWMSFLVRLYRITGVKAILRLCTRLRAAAMDWTSLLHGFHQRQPLARNAEPEEILRILRGPEADESDFFTRQAVVNRAEWLADGVRYTAWAGIFSGNGQDLSAGEKGWLSIRRDHGAVCGGTTADVMLAGTGTDRAIDAAALAAWTEAFADQATALDAPWALNALTRLVWNGLPACIGEKGTVFFQRVNTLRTEKEGAGILCPETDAERETHVLARLARAYAAARKSAVAATPEGFAIQLQLPGRYAVSAGKEPVMLRADEDEIQIRGKKGLRAPIRLFAAETETRDIRVEMGEKTAAAESRETEEGIYLTWSGDGSESCRIVFTAGSRILVQREHHEGISCYRGNRLLAMDAENADYRVAACGEPEVADGQPMLPVRAVPGWRKNRGIPTDIPVLPEAEGEIRRVPLVPYRDAAERISVFPRTRT